MNYNEENETDIGFYRGDTDCGAGISDVVFCFHRKQIFYGIFVLHVYDSVDVICIHVCLSYGSQGF